MLRIFLFSMLLALHLGAQEANFTVSAFTFNRPADWKQVEPRSPMRKAQIEVPGKDGGKSAEIVFFYFGGGQGGDVQSNVQRWFGQFSGTVEGSQKVEPLETTGAKVTLVSTEGVLKASPMSGIAEDQPASALLGAIIEHADGAVFVKLTGPAELVKASKEKFTGMIKAAAEKK